MDMAKTAENRPGRGSARPLRHEHELFVSGDDAAADLDLATVRPVVAESWRRSPARGVDPDLDGARPAAAPEPGGGSSR